MVKRGRGATTATRGAVAPPWEHLNPAAWAKIDEPPLTRAGDLRKQNASSTARVASRSPRGKIAEGFERNA